MGEYSKLRYNDSVNNIDQKSFYRKLYIVIAITAMIVAGLLYLLVSGSTDKIRSTLSASRTNAAEAVQGSASASPTSTPSPASSVSAAPTASAIADTVSDASLQRIVNKTHMIDASYVPADLSVPSVASNGTQTLRSEASQALEKMFAAASNDGISLYLISGYRSYQDQAALYQYYTNESGTDFADSIDSLPGASEHQLGLAADIGEASRACELDDCFQSSAAYAWLSKHAPEYGYIMRYPAQKQTITGIVFSPWAVRYIGSDAEKIAQSGKTLEEYYGLS